MNRLYKMQVIKISEIRTREKKEKQHYEVRQTCLIAFEAFLYMTKIWRKSECFCHSDYTNRL